MPTIITGSNGLLGQKIVAQFLAEGKDFIATSKGENRNPDCPADKYRDMDIVYTSSINKVFDEFEIDVVINTAAMTLVDACEDVPDVCRSINVDGVENLFNACVKRGIFFVQVSTDFVFDGEKGDVYLEDDTPNPLSVYAQSKKDAEDYLLQHTDTNWAILRTIIVYGSGNNLSRSNIVLWAREALKEGKELKIVNDQFRAPTWAADLAWACIKAGELKAKGIYHICGPETMSIYELVCRIADFDKRDKSIIIPISSSTLNQKAKRPPRTGFDITKARTVLGYEPLTLEESLKELDS